MLGSLSDAVRKFWRRIVVFAGFMFLSYCLLAFGHTSPLFRCRLLVLFWAEVLLVVRVCLKQHVIHVCQRCFGPLAISHGIFNDFRGSPHRRRRGKRT